MTRVVVTDKNDICKRTLFWYYDVVETEVEGKIVFLRPSFGIPYDSKLCPPTTGVRGSIHSDLKLLIVKIIINFN